jgi:hypothetical protein
MFGNLWEPRTPGNHQEPLENNSFLQDFEGFWEPLEVKAFRKPPGTRRKLLVFSGI